LYSFKMRSTRVHLSNRYNCVYPPGSLLANLNTAGDGRVEAVDICADSTHRRLLMHLAYPVNADTTSPGVAQTGIGSIGATTCLFLADLFGAPISRAGRARAVQTVLAAATHLESTADPRVPSKDDKAVASPSMRAAPSAATHGRRGSFSPFVSALGAPPAPKGSTPAVQADSSGGLLVAGTSEGGLWIGELRFAFFFSSLSISCRFCFILSYHDVNLTCCLGTGKTDRV
jgi:hypothetical protein